MKIDVIGKEVRQFDDKNIPGLKHVRIKLHCYHEPRRVDKNCVTGFQIVSFNVFDDSIFFSEVNKLPIPCQIDAEIEKVDNFTNLVDFKLIE